MIEKNNNNNNKNRKNTFYNSSSYYRFHKLYCTSHPLLCYVLQVDPVSCYWILITERFTKLGDTLVTGPSTLVG